MNKKVAVIGSRGYVGKAYAAMLAKKHEIVEVDPVLELNHDAPDFCAGSEQQRRANECELAVICVPTPMSEDGSVDLSIVEDVFKWLTVPLVLIKSTIPPGTSERLYQAHLDKRIVFSPEFIGEGGYNVPFWKDWPHPTDASLHSFVILGGMRSDCLEVADFLKPILGPDCRFMFTDWRTAELVKYTENAFLATKVSFCNELYDIAQTFGADYDELRELWLLDGRVGRSHTLVYRDSRGFGGKCLPKDVNGIVKASEKAGYEPKLLKAVLKFNETLR